MAIKQFYSLKKYAYCILLINFMKYLPLTLFFYYILDKNFDGLVVMIITL